MCCRVSGLTQFAFVRSAVPMTLLSSPQMTRLEVEEERKISSADDEQALRADVVEDGHECYDRGRRAWMTVAGACVFLIADWPPSAVQDDILDGS